VFEQDYIIRLIKEMIRAILKLRYCFILISMTKMMNFYRNMDFAEMR